MNRVLYEELATYLAGRGIGSYLQHPEMLVVSNHNPVLPASNCFWVTIKREQWYLATFLPTSYRVPEGGNICEICEAVYRSSKAALFTIEESLAARLGLVRLSDEEAERLAVY